MLHPFSRPPTPAHPPVGPSIHAESVVREFHEALSRSSDMAVAVAAIQALTTVIRLSTATTVMGLEKELKDAAAALQRHAIYVWLFGRND